MMVLSVLSERVGIHLSNLQSPVDKPQRKCFKEKFLCNKDFSIWL
jgi:hypothetical protein